MRSQVCWQVALYVRWQASIGWQSGTQRPLACAFALGALHVGSRSGSMHACKQVQVKVHLLLWLAQVACCSSGCVRLLC
jgi:hypothetical protein